MSLCILVENSGGACPVLIAGHKQFIRRISKGSQNICIYKFIIRPTCSLLVFTASKSGFVAFLFLKLFLFAYSHQPLSRDETAPVLATQTRDPAKKVFNF